MKRIKLYLTLIIVLVLFIIGFLLYQSSKQEEKNTIEQQRDQKVVQKVEESMGIQENIVPTIAEIKNFSAKEVLEDSWIEFLKKENRIEELFYIQDITKEIISRINHISYQENDNIELEDLRYLKVLHIGFDGKTHIGELIVNQTIAEKVLEIMKELYDYQYPIEKMILIDEYQADDESSMSDNNTSAFNYRVIAGTNRLSKHGQGLAIDINPRYNPCVKIEQGVTIVEPENGAEFVDRKREFSYKIDANDFCCKLFKKHGFVWGGDWKSLKDYQHFEKE